MDERQRAALLTALTTEHFVLQTANNSTYAEASARSMLYVMALSSALVAMGFVASSTEILVPFAAIVMPVVFVLGLFTVVRLVETALDSMHCLKGIARIRACYRTLGPEAEEQFAAARGRWPEVAGVGIAFLTRFFSPSAPAWAYTTAGIAGALLLTWLFYAYQRWRFEDYERHQPR